MNKELAKTLTTALVQFIDRERPKESICCSSYECEKMEKAFENGTYDVVESIIKQKLNGLTEFEQDVRDMIVDALTTVHEVTNGKLTSSVVIDNDTTHSLAAGLLKLAKKELLSYADESNPAIEAMADLERTFSCNPEKLPIWLKDELNKAFKKGQEASHEDYIKGYANGYKDAEKRYNESVAYHYPEPVLPGVVYKAPNNWNEVTAVPNLDSGTLTAKVEG